MKNNCGVHEEFEGIYYCFCEEMFLCSKCYEAHDMSHEPELNSVKNHLGRYFTQWL